MDFLIFLMLLWQLGVSTAGPLDRYRRDFVPPGAAFGPQVARPPQPDPLRPEHVDPNNPYLESLAEPINPSYGLGVGYQRPFILGGAANIPTGNLFQPTAPLNGTFGFTQLRNVRFGVQGGQFFPWQDPKYGTSAKYLSMLQYRQQQQQQMLADQAAQQAAQQNNPPPDPFAPANAGGQSEGGRRQQLQQLPAVDLATPPPLPANFAAS